MRIFRRAAGGPHALAEAMTGVRLGERLLYLGAGTPALFAALAAKAGLTGRARAIVESERARERVTEAAARGGVLVEIGLGGPASIPAESDGFDVAVIDATSGMVLALADADRTALGAEVLRALRPRGRAIVVEHEAAGVMAVFKGKAPEAERFRAEGSAAKMLEGAGFFPVRVLADRDGQRFTEGWKKPASSELG
jgi:ubiquinone/menaquinone biosynthesis C-methylase UbiE